jgi:hypothetical protein
MESGHARSIKRDRLLSPTERKRLVNRTAAPTTAVNDARVRKKLTYWLKTIGDVQLIIANLPEEQSRKIVTDIDIFVLFELIEMLMKLKRFGAVEKDPDNPLNWTISLDGITQRKAENSDIVRSYVLLLSIRKLQDLSPLTSPIPLAALLSEMKNQPGGEDRVTGADRIAVERYDNAIDGLKKQIQDWKEEQRRLNEEGEPPK